MIEFKKTLLKEYKDIFGLGMERNDPNDPHAKINPKEENPIKFLNFEYITDILSKRDIRGRIGNNKFDNMVVWGDVSIPGSLKIEFNSNLQINFFKCNNDLDGNPTWAIKRNLMTNRAGGGGSEFKIIEEVYNIVKEIDQLELDSPLANWKKLESFTLELSNEMQKVCRTYFIFQGVRKLMENKYIIRFGVGGQGLQAPDQSRIIENQTWLFYDELCGKVRLTNKNIETNVGGHNWKIKPNDTNFVFFPTQPKEEIIKIMSNIIKNY